MNERRAGSLATSGITSGDDPRRGKRGTIRSRSAHWRRQIEKTYRGDQQSPEQQCLSSATVNLGRGESMKQVGALTVVPCGNPRGGVPEKYSWRDISWRHARSQNRRLTVRCRVPNGWRLNRRCTHLIVGEGAHTLLAILPACRTRTKTVVLSPNQAASPPKSDADRSRTVGSKSSACAASISTQSGGSC